MTKTSSNKKTNKPRPQKKKQDMRPYQSTALTELQTVENPNHTAEHLEFIKTTIGHVVAGKNVPVAVRDGLPNDVGRIVANYCKQRKAWFDTQGTQRAPNSALRDALTKAGIKPKS